ncbi:transglutaminase domain-containing protein [Candidatus Woesearchaeota archaeon]|nr:transglutaminase domain-containing protein [Candidatus Woesearchaeota archaeon]
MNKKHLAEDLKDIQSELGDSEQEFSRYRQPLIWIISLFLIFIIVLMVVPYYSIRLDPEPKRIPSIGEIVSSDFVPGNVTWDRNNFYLFVNPSSVKPFADKIISLSCPEGNRICYAKALFYFVRDNFNYASDPLSHEYVKSAEESLYYRVGDCDDASVLLLNLEEAIGIESDFVFIPQHVYVRIYLPEALSRYKQNDWINLDATCKECNFGDMPYKNRKK